MADTVPDFSIKKLNAFAFICTVSIRGSLNNGPLFLKTLEKFVQPENEHFAKNTHISHGRNRSRI